MDKLAITKCQNRWRHDVFYDTVTVNGEPLFEWFGQYNDEAKSLCEAFDLMNNSETETVWICLGQVQIGVCSYVPLLACPDDMDFSCTILMAEQISQNEEIVWHRFGWWVTGDIEQQNADMVEWIDNIPPLNFSRENFINTFSKFRDITIESIIANASVPEKFVELPNIEFPATKELWELEDFSYLQDTHHSQKITSFKKVEIALLVLPDSDSSELHVVRR